ncbi:MAG: PD-(D/E)XK nuclease family transposase, partial [Prevotella sp.]|nr:PD-(D/E)XK nuclease family transposase [Prevotella sp.]
PVYALNFVNENFMNDVDEYYHYYHLVHDKYTDKVIDGLHLIFVELKKFKPQTYAEKKMQVLWLRFLTEINDETREVPAELLENAEVSEALEIVERAAFDDAEMRAYDKFWDAIASRKSEINAVKREAEKAKAEAEEAKAKLKQEKFDTARKLKAMNVMTTEQIAEVTGLSNAEIEAL